MKLPYKMATQFSADVNDITALYMSIYARSHDKQ